MKVQCSICGISDNVVHIEQDYYLCGNCVNERLEEYRDLRHYNNHLIDTIKVLSKIIAEIEL